jgi:cytochrome c551/c552
MTSSKLVFFSLFVALTGCMKPQKSAGDRNSDEAPRTNQTTTGIQDSAVGNGNGNGNGTVTGNGNTVSAPSSEVLTSVSVKLNLLPAGTSTVLPKVYADVQSIFQENCVECHKAAPSRSPLNLAEFPFKNSTTRDTEKQIFDKIVNRMTSTVSPMPPPPDARLSQADQDAILSWINAGALETYTAVGPRIDLANYAARIQFKLDQNPASDWMKLPAFDSQNSNLSLGKIKIGSTLVINVSVQGPSGEEILFKSFSQIVPETGKIILPVQATAEDQQPPQVGRLAIDGEVDSNSISVSWTGATDNVTKADELEYSLYLLNATASTSAETVIASGTVLINSQKNVGRFKAENLQPSTDYAFALLVKDSKGNTASYPLLKGKTSEYVPPLPPIVDTKFPECTTGRFSPDGLNQWRNDAAKKAKRAMDTSDLQALREVSQAINNCFKEKTPACLERTYDFALRRDTAPRGLIDITTEAKKLPEVFHAPDFNAANPRYIVPEDIEQIASSNGWLSVRYKSRASGGFDRGSSNLLMIYVPGDKVTPQVSFDRWINIAFDPDPIKDAFKPAPASGKLKMKKESTLTLVSLERKTGDKPAVVYFQMFSRVGTTDLFKTGVDNTMNFDLESCFNCHPNGLRAISPLGFHTRDDQDKTVWSDVLKLNLNSEAERRTFMQALADLPAEEEKLPPEDREKIQKMNDAMDEAAGFVAVSWGEGWVNGVKKPLLVPNGYGPIVGPTSPLNKIGRTKEFILGGNGRSGCYKKRTSVSVHDEFGRPSGAGPNNLAVFSKPDAISDPEQLDIDWEKVRNAMNCEKCHNGVQRGSLSTTRWDQIDFKILVDRSMPLNHDENLSRDERLALANCLQAEFDLEKTLEIEWMTEKSCEQ